MNPVEIICKKRNGEKLSANEIEFFIQKCTKGDIPDYQTSALLMATYFQGMDAEETCHLTKAMIATGEKLRFNDQVIRVDKHSTGGVGDKVSILLAPILAALEVQVPMIAGRGLGHTGGTLDKLESIPGFQVRLSTEKFLSVLKNAGAVIAGQNESFVPADRLLYSLRDVTATVECIPLITASILSKKSAEGISALVMDIKVGNGAFMKNMKQAQALAQSIVSTGKKLGLKVKALITDMNQPLGEMAGNSLEILECIDLLQNNTSPNSYDLRDLTLELAAHMLVQTKKSSSLSAARVMAKKTLADGSAWRSFLKICREQGAKEEFLKSPQTSIKVSSDKLEIISSKTGYISKIETEALGLLLVRLGGGRMKTSDKVDASVGFKLHSKLGSQIKKDQTLVTVYFSKDRMIQNFQNETNLKNEFKQCFHITSKPLKKNSFELIKKVIE